MGNRPCLCGTVDTVAVDSNPDLLVAGVDHACCYLHPDWLIAPPIAVEHAPGQAISVGRLHAAPKLQVFLSIWLCYAVIRKWNGEKRVIVMREEKKGGNKA